MLRIEFPQREEKGNSRNNKRKVGGGNYYQNIFSILQRERGRKNIWHMLATT